MELPLASLAFRQPAWLWALAALALVWLLHLLRLHARTTPTAALELWIEATRGVPRLSLWALAGLDRRLALLTLSVALAALALAGPLWVSRAPGGAVALVFDTGADMGFRDADGQTRLDQAAAEARRLLRELPRAVGARIVAIGPGGMAQIGSPMPPVQALAALDRLPQPATRPTEAGALVAAAVALNDAPHAQAYVFTAKPLDFGIDDRPAPTLVRVANRPHNAGIVTLSADTLHNQALAVVQRIGEAQPLAVRIGIVTDVAVETFDEPLVFDAHGQAIAVVDAPLAGARRVEARLMFDGEADALSADDTAAIERTEPDTVTVAAEGRVGRRVEQALEAIPEVRLRRGEGAMAAADVGIFGGTLPAPGAGPLVAVLIEPPAPWGGFEPRVFDPPREMPVFALDSAAAGERFGFDPRGETLRVARYVAPRAGIEPVLGRDDIVAVARADRGGRRAWFVGLDTGDRAPWTRSAQFPLFWTALVDDARGYAQRAGRFEAAEGALSREVTTSAGEPAPYDSATLRIETLTQRRPLSPWLLSAAALSLAALWWVATKEDDDREGTGDEENV